MTAVEAVQTRIKEILQDVVKNVEDPSTVTMRMIKEKLAPHFGDQWDEILSEHKDFIKKESIELIEAAEKLFGDATVTNVQTPNTVSKSERKISHIPNSEKRRRSESTTSKDESTSDSEGHKPSKAKRVSKTKTTKITTEVRPKPTSEVDNAVTFSEEVNRLKVLAKNCGLTIPVNVYKGQPSSEELEERIGSFLSSKGLRSLNPNKQEIAKLRNKINLEKELEGIETSNIIGGRRRHEQDEEQTAKKGRVYTLSCNSSDDESLPKNCGQ